VGTGSDAPLVALRAVVKNYQALRPLRVESLTLSPGESIVVMGPDASSAEMLVGLITGAVLPDSGEIDLFGQSTRAIADSEAWLALLDRVGIVTDRAVLIGQFTVEQNIAMPFTLEIDPMVPEVRDRVMALAEEVGLARTDLGLRVAETNASVQARVRLARALALGPSVLVSEHPSATLERDTVKGFAADLRRVVASRALAALTITGDEVLASALGGSVVTHEPATGKLRPRSVWRKLFGG
jgi:ABC-type lipoprotein export system ATPase subunit